MKLNILYFLKKVVIICYNYFVIIIYSLFNFLFRVKNTLRFFFISCKKDTKYIVFFEKSFVIICNYLCYKAVAHF